MAAMTKPVTVAMVGALLCSLGLGACFRSHQGQDEDAPRRESTEPTSGGRVTGPTPNAPSTPMPQAGDEAIDGPDGPAPTRAFDPARYLDELDVAALGRLCRAIDDWSIWTQERLNTGSCVLGAVNDVLFAENVSRPIARCEALADECLAGLPRPSAAPPCADQLARCHTRMSDLTQCLDLIDEVASQYDQVSCRSAGDDSAPPGISDEINANINGCASFFAECPEAIYVISRTDPDAL